VEGDGVLACEEFFVGLVELVYELWEADEWGGCGDGAVFLVELEGDGGVVDGCEGFGVLG